MELKRIDFPFKIKSSVLALGSQTKNTVCFLKGNYAYLSQVHADLSNPDDFMGFQKCVKYFFKKHPKIIAYDLHPEYQSTKYALSLNATRYTLYAIQHHHAHIASCMLENGLKNQKVIGVAFDGTGFGSDNKLWGAEFIICDYKSLQRSAHLKEVSLLGGEKAILEPYRIAALWLYLIYKDKFLDLKIPFVRGIDKKKWRVLKQMYLSGFNSPSASSMGRLFDAAASLVFAKYRARFEAELAMRLERMATGHKVTKSQSHKLPVKGYGYRITKQEQVHILDPVQIFRGIVKDLQAGVPQEAIAYRFHLTVAQMIRDTCVLLRRNSGINGLVLSGGVFQNKLLLNLSSALLYKEGFNVYAHKILPCNDSSLSIGQAVIAASSKG